MAHLNETQHAPIPAEVAQAEQERLLARLLDEVFSLSAGEGGPRSDAVIEFIAEHRDDHPEFEELAAIILYAREREAEAENAA